MCLRKEPGSPYADRDGYVPFGTLVDYTGGRSNGCTSWSPSDVQQILAMVKNNPTTLYIYPDAADVNAVARAVAAGQSPSRAELYWNASCLRAIGSPKFWPKETLEPIIVQYTRNHRRAATANADVPRAVKFVPCCWLLAPSAALSRTQRARRPRFKAGSRRRPA